MEEVRPRIRVAGILIENNKILLIQHHKNNKKYWLIPGGGNDWGETTKQALVREYKEETNLDIEVDEFLFFSETISPDKERHVVNLFFKVHRNNKNDDNLSRHQRKFVKINERPKNRNLFRKFMEWLKIVNIS